MIYTKSELKKALFFEIATQPKSKSFEKLSEKDQEVWTNNFHTRYSRDNSALKPSDTYETNAQFVPEFGTIVGAAIGVVNDDLTVTVISTEPGKEKQVLEEVKAALDGYANLTAAGYNLTGYTIPYLIKRMIVNKVELPFHLRLKGKKPWEIFLIDVMKDYQGTVFESLKLETLCNTLGVDYTAYDENDPVGSAERYLSSVIKCALSMTM